MGNVLSIDLSKITDWKLLNEKYLLVIVVIQMIIGKNKVFEEVPNEDQNTISVRWLVTNNNNA